MFWKSSKDSNRDIEIYLSINFQWIALENPPEIPFENSSEDYSKNLSETSS